MPRPRPSPNDTAKRNVFILVALICVSLVALVYVYMNIFPGGAVEAPSEPSPPLQEQKLEHKQISLREIESATDAEELVDKMITMSKVAIFSFSYCPYCKRAKRIIADSPVDPKDVSIVEMDEHQIGKEIHALIKKITGQRTVPNIFIKGQHIGGSDDLMRLKESKELAALLQ